MHKYSSFAALADASGHLDDLAELIERLSANNALPDGIRDHPNSTDQERMYILRDEPEDADPGLLIVNESSSELIAYEADEADEADEA